MKILALEFSSSQRSVAVAVDDSVRGHAHERGDRETHAFALIDSALQQARLRREDVECIAVGIGPGSYTGIRIAIAIGQGWQLARGVKLLGISSADCIAAQAWEQGMRGPASIIFDAQQGEFFLARYQLGGGSAGVQPARHLSAWVQVETFRLMTDADWKRSDTGEMMIRADAGENISAVERLILPDARMLAKLAQSRSDFVNGAALEPIYLRKATFVKAAPPRNPIQ